ncbi:DUF4446 family protein [Paenibacillus donghaensis]|uniref:DUF4446 domain-containing protein n=1 Tax=Paenibacillus donghaensis TaxID=414771 RepID=A0A2Z2KE12_9BACL|nr:DUF4446 family protein [Paenibacillus donghaensis]ASA24986.1 hypothetical protein B9T62_32070 [Paenibacillus donghaensis]
MSEMNQLFNDQLAWFVLGVSAMLLVLLVILIMQGAKLRTMRRKYESMMGGNGVEDLEGLLIDLKNQADMLEEEQHKHKAALEATGVRIRSMKSNIALKRYNAFGERGNNLSFSLALVDDDQSGVVITSLHNRENSYIYSKPMDKGESQIPLSPEEKEVIALALQRT